MPTKAELQAKLTAAESWAAEAMLTMQSQRAEIDRLTAALARAGSPAESHSQSAPPPASAPALVSRQAPQPVSVRVPPFGR